MTHFLAGRRAVRSLLVGAAGLLGSGLWAVAAAQNFGARDHAASAALNGDSGSGYRVAVGERAIYDVEYKGRGVGTGSLEVMGRETTNGYSTFHATMKLSAGFLFAKVNDQFDSWFDPHRYFSRRFAQDQRELTHTRKKNYEIVPERGMFVETFTGDVDSLATDEPLDDISFLYFVRTMPLKVGDVDTIPRYFKSRPRGDREGAAQGDGHRSCRHVQHDRGAADDHECRWPVRPGWQGRGLHERRCVTARW